MSRFENRHLDRSNSLFLGVYHERLYVFLFFFHFPLFFFFRKHFIFTLNCNEATISPSVSQISIGMATVVWPQEFIYLFIFVWITHNSYELIGHSIPYRHRGSRTTSWPWFNHFHLAKRLACPPLSSFLLFFNVHDMCHNIICATWFINKFGQFF